MDKPTVSPRRFVELMNERLVMHPLYREGMHVYAIPAHAEHPRSLVCVGPRGTEGICATIENIVRGECDVFPEIEQEWHRHYPASVRPEARADARHGLRPDLAAAPGSELRPAPHPDPHPDPHPAPHLAPPRGLRADGRPETRTQSRAR